MKNLTLLTLCFLLILGLNQTLAQIPTASEIFEKAVKFHDPEGKWNSYSGKLKMNVCFANGNTYGTEIVEIDVAKDFYQWTRLVNGFKVVKGIKDGKIFYSVNGNSNPSDEEKNVFGINEAGIRMMKEHHNWHFGKFSYLKDVGVVLQKEVKKVIFDEKECYQLTFIGDSAKVKNPYFAGKNIFCIDAKSFAICGWIYSKGFGKLQGTIDINGIKIPAVETWYSEENNSLQGITLFSRGDDSHNLPNEFQTKSQPTGSNIGYISTHLLKLEDEDALNKLKEPLKEINETLAKMGYPECGYVIYKVTPDFKSDYTHIMEGWWLNKEVYDLTHNHPDFKPRFEKYRSLFENVLMCQTYFRVEKMTPKLY